MDTSDQDLMLERQQQDLLLFLQQQQLLQEEEKLKKRSDSRETDSDGDGLPDWEERLIGTDPYLRDSDADGLDDWEEVHHYHTNPKQRDIDEVLEVSTPTQQQYYRPATRKRSPGLQGGDLEL